MSIKILGLTGSIGTGKTTALNLFKKQNIKILGADQFIHSLFKTDHVLKKIVSSICPQAILNDKIDRTILREFAFESNVSLKHLEDYLHPKVFQFFAHKIKTYNRMNVDMVVCEVPLLFEKKSQRRFDFIIVTSVNPYIQEMRTINRSHITKKRFASIVEKQINTHIKEKMCDFSLHTGLSKAMIMSNIIDALNLCQKKTKQTSHITKWMGCKPKEFFCASLRKVN